LTAYQMKINRTFDKIISHLGIDLENEQSKINFISSEISDQILRPMSFEESQPRCIFILGKWYVCKRKPCL